MELESLFFKKKRSFTLQIQNFHTKYRKFITLSSVHLFEYRSETLSPARTLRFCLDYRFGTLQESVSPKKGVSNNDQKPCGTEGNRSGGK